MNSKIMKLKYLYLFQDDICRKFIRAVIDRNIFADRSMELGKKIEDEQFSVDEHRLTGEQKKLKQQLMDDKLHNEALYLDSDKALDGMHEVLTEVETRIYDFEKQVGFFGVLKAKFLFLIVRNNG